MDGKLPAVGNENFNSAHQIEGARVTFIEQLKQNSMAASDPAHNQDSVYDSQSALYQRYVGSAGSIAGGFRQFISEVRRSVDVSDVPAAERQRMQSE